MKPIVSRITDKWIKEHSPCIEALNWWKKRERNPMKILAMLMKAKKYDWANWFIVWIMTYHDYVSYAVYAAEQVIEIYEKQYPDDKRPRQAIEAARKCIDNPSVDNKNASASAANAANASANASAYASAYAANVSASASAAYASAYAANAAYAASAAYAAAAAYAVSAAMKCKIIEYGIKLLKEK